MVEKQGKDEGMEVMLEDFGRSYQLDAAKAQALLLRQVLNSLDAQVENVITPQLIEKLNNIYFIGCGDSFFAAVSARLAFDKYTGVRVEPVEALEFSRYLVEYIPTDSLVIAISYSGMVARTREGVSLARLRGIPTLAVTGYRHSPLAKDCAMAIVQGLPKVEADWGTYDEWHHIGMGNYLVSLLGLFLIAFRIAQLRGTLTAREVEALKTELMACSNIILQTSLNNILTAQRIAAELYYLNDFTFIGGGPSYGAAMFAAAKILEQPNLNGVPSELEEWAHLQYFLVRPKVHATFVIAPPGRSRDRALEQVHGIRDMGGAAIVICDQDDQELISAASFAMPVAGKLREEFSSLAYVIPAEIFATALHQLRGVPPLVPPFDLKQQDTVNRRQIRESQMRQTLDGF